MATANIVGSWSKDGFAYMAIAVVEPGGRVEYIGSLPIDAAFNALTTPQKKAALVAACKVVRDAVPSAPVDLAMSGAVAV